MSDHAMKPIWYFVGLILTIMGAIITLTGVYYLFNPPQTATVLGSTHPDIWWGALMTAFGLVMYLKTRKPSA